MSSLRLKKTQVFNGSKMSLEIDNYLQLNPPHSEQEKEFWKKFVSSNKKKQQQSLSSVTIEELSRLEPPDNKLN